MIGRKVQHKIYFKIIISAVMLAFLFSMIGSVTPVMATVPVAYDDGYSVLMNTPLSVATPGVLTYDYDKEGTPLSVNTYAQPSYGSVVLNTNGSFVYTPNTDFVGNDSFTYNIISGGEISNTATVNIVVYADPIYGCIEDVDGANDVSGQGDLTTMCTDLSPANPDTFGITWNWDDIQGPGGNTYFACSLYDSNANGFADYSICVQLLPDANLDLTYQETTYYTCNDAWTDRCGQPSTPINVEYCSTEVSNDDPFGDPLNLGDYYPDDLKATCAIPNTIVSGPEPTSLINVCSYTSVANPNSNPSDCTAPTAGAYAFLTIIKHTTPPTAGVSFDYSIDPPTWDATATTTVTTDESGSGASDTFLVEADTYSVLETIPSGWLLDLVSCTGQTSGDESALVINAFENVVCTFTNSANIDLQVTKSDGDYFREDSTPLSPLSRFDIFPYTITVEYLPRDETISTGATATNVEMTDSLDPNLAFVSEPPEFTYTTSVDFTNPTCSYDTNTHVVTCTAAEMNLGDWYTVTFDVAVLPTAPLTGFVETGTCWADTSSSTGWLGLPIDPDPTDIYTPSVQEADICNLVNVTTTSYEYDLTNNDDSEPADLGVPTAVDLLSFTATGVAGGIRLDWATEMETENQGFNLYRAPSLHAPRTKINDELISGNPGGMGAEYSHLDEVNSRNTFYYWLESVDIYDNAEVHEDYASARALKNIK